MTKKPTRGESLWAEITELHDLEPWQRVILEEACRCADLLDELDALIVARGAADVSRWASRARRHGGVQLSQRRGVATGGQLDPAEQRVAHEHAEGPDVGGDRRRPRLALDHPGPPRVPGDVVRVDQV